MKIYIDFDDVLCETARALAVLAKAMFGRDVPYEDIKFFNLQKSFSLSDEQIARLMERAHEHDFLLGLEPTPGGVEGISNIQHGMSNDQVNCASGQNETVLKPSLDIGYSVLDIGYSLPPPLLSVADFNTLHFDIAVDDSPDALDLLAPRTDCHTIIFDRPWNRSYPPLPNMSRAHSWEEVLERFS